MAVDLDLDAKMHDVYTKLMYEASDATKWQRSEAFWFYNGYCHVDSKVIVAWDFDLEQYIIYDHRTDVTLYKEEFIKPIYDRINKNFILSEEDHVAETLSKENSVLDSVEHKETLRLDDMPGDKGQADGVFVPYWMLVIMLFILWWLK